MQKILLFICNVLIQGSATPGTRAKSGTPEGSAWQAKRFHAQANFKLLGFNKLAFEFVSQFQSCGFKSHSTIEGFLIDRTFTDVETIFLSALKFSEESRTPTEMRTFFLFCTEIFRGKQCIYRGEDLFLSARKIGQPFGTRRSFYLDSIKKWHAALKRLPTPVLIDLMGKMQLFLGNKF